MPLLSSTEEEFACNDEVKVYIDEGDEEEPKKISDNLKEDKLNLVIEVEDHEKQPFQSDDSDKCDIFKLPYYGHLAMAAAAAYAQNNRSSSPKNSFLNPVHDINNLQNPSKLSTYYPGLLQSPIAAAASLFHSNNNPLSFIGNNVNPFASFSPSFMSNSQVKDHLEQLSTSENDNKSNKDVGFRVKSPNLLHSELIKAASLYNLTKSPKNSENKINSSDFNGSSESSSSWPMQFFNTPNVKSPSSSTSNTSGSNRPFSPNNMLSQVAAAASAQFLSSLAAAAVACSDSTNSTSNDCSPKISSNSCGNNNLLSFYPYSAGNHMTLGSGNSIQNISQGHSVGLYPGMNGEPSSGYHPQNSHQIRNNLMRSRNPNSSGHSHSSVNFINETFNECSKVNSELKTSKTFLSFDPNNNKQGNHSSSSMKDQLKSNFSTRKIECDERRSNKPHIKKPLNAFMLYMKEMRPKVQDECTLKESAAINQILGKKWHELPKEQQAKYYEMARKEKELHAQMFPGWSARDNYAMHSKRKKRRKMMIEQKTMIHHSNPYRMNSYPGQSTSQQFSISMNSRNDSTSKDANSGFNRSKNCTSDLFYNDEIHDTSLIDNIAKNKILQKLPNQPSECIIGDFSRQENNKVFSNIDSLSNLGNNSDGLEANSNSQSNSPNSSRENSSFSPGLNNSDIGHPKKCRARFGLDQQEKWCKPCRRKKKCIRYYMNGFDNEEISMRSCSEANYISSNYCPDETMPTLGGTSLISSVNQFSDEVLRKRKFEGLVSGYIPENDSTNRSIMINNENEIKSAKITDNSLNLLNDLRMNFKLFKSKETSNLSHSIGKTRVNDVNWSNFKFSPENFFSVQFDNQSNIDRNSTPIQGHLKP